MHAFKSPNTMFHAAILASVYLGMDVSACVHAMRMPLHALLKSSYRNLMTLHTQVHTD
jgi:hypothetical protein